MCRERWGVVLLWVAKIVGAFGLFFFYERLTGMRSEREKPDRIPKCLCFLGAEHPFSFKQSLQYLQCVFVVHVRVLSRQKIKKQVYFSTFFT
jgi:hypothetical protein